MTAKEAMIKAKEYAEKRYRAIIISCYEFDDFYAFNTNYSGVDEIVPDMPTIQVFKKTGDVQDMFPDQPYVDKKTFEWIDPFDGAKKIDIETL